MEANLHYLNLLQRIWSIFLLKLKWPHHHIHRQLVTLRLTCRQVAYQPQIPPLLGTAILHQQESIFPGRGWVR